MVRCTWIDFRTAMFLEVRYFDFRHYNVISTNKRETEILRSRCLCVSRGTQVITALTMKQIAKACDANFAKNNQIKIDPDLELSLNIHCWSFKAQPLSPKNPNCKFKAVNCAILRHVWIVCSTRSCESFIESRWIRTLN